MKIRFFLKLILALGITSSPLTAQIRKIPPQKSVKKGLCASEKKHSKDEYARRLKKLEASWYYNWTGKTGFKKGEIEAEFVPMVWGSKPWSMKPLSWLKVSKKTKNIQPLLGFNEPDSEKQSNITVAEALDLWKRLEKTGRRLGSPATVKFDGEWMKAFMKGAEKRGLKINYVCIHSYGGDNAKAFINRVKKAHKLYNKPIWITEFAVADWKAVDIKNNKYKEANIVAFLKEVLPELEKLDFVERYAWFSTTQDHPALGTSALFDKQGNLTAVGKAYASIDKK